MIDFTRLAHTIKLLGERVGLSQIGIVDPRNHQAKLAAECEKLNRWIEQGFHGTMDFLTKWRDVRANPNLLLPNCQSIICCALAYPANSKSKHIASFAQGRDYHKIMRQLLNKLITEIKIELAAQNYAENFQYRICVDSAPILEKFWGERAGLGWIGNNTLLVNEKFGSQFALGEILTNLPLPEDQPISTAAQSCKNCRRCLDACPTKALVSPRVLDARRCIAYLTIEHKNAIPEDLAPLVGENIFGCDLCQRCCPWNAKSTANTASNAHFAPRRYCELSLDELLAWDEQTYLINTAGSALHRLGYARWRRNLLVAAEK